jgi:hypothetical protein
MKASNLSPSSDPGVGVRMHILPRAMIADDHRGVIED